MSGERSVGVALDGTTMTVVWRSARLTGAWRSASVACDAMPDGIRRAIAAVDDDAAGWDQANVTLMRPLANARTVRFPAMSRAMLEEVLERDWSRYVIGHRATGHTASARKTGRDAWRAVFAPTDTLDAIAETASQRSWRNLRVVSGDDALAVAARALGADANSVVIVCASDGPSNAVCLRGGEPTVGRRFLADASDEDVDAFIALATRGQAGVAVHVIGGNGRATALVKTLGSSGHRARALDVGAPTDASTTTIMAIVGTLGAPVLELRSPRARVAWARDLRGVTRWLLVGAVAAVIGAYLVDEAGAESALSRVRRHRADISANVRRVSAEQVRFSQSANAANALAARETNASRASDVLTAVALALPPGAALTTFNVSGDSLSIEGESKGSVSVYEALRAVPTLDRVRLAAPLRQERQAGDVTVERFAFNAHIRTVP